MNKREAKTNQVIGRRLRERRILKGLSLMRVGEAIGVTFQAVQKYESGANVITPWKLMRLAETLDVPVTYFFAERDSPAQGEELSIAILRLAERLQWIERHMPKAFRKLRDNVAKLTRERD